MMVIAGDVAIKGRALGSSWVIRAYPRRRNGRELRFALGLLFSEDPVGCFGQVSGHGADGLLMALAPGDTLVKATDVTIRRASAIEADSVGGFDEGPLEVAIDVWAGRPEAGFAAARVNSGSGARVGGQLVGGDEPRTAAHFERDHDGEQEANAGTSEEQLNRGRWLKNGVHLVLEGAHLTVQI